MNKQQHRASTYRPTKMLDTDDIDDDYFNPIPSTSLASIFTNKQHTPSNEDTDNESLKYTPPKPQIPAKPAVESKATDCLFACALFAYEWSEDNYVAKGKVGLAIIKNTKNNNHDIVLYDSNKRTLSCASITSHLEVTVKDGNYISYHDNFKKYWTIYANEDEIRKILDNLTSLNGKVKHCSHVAEGPPEPNKPEIDEKEKEQLQQSGADSKESDTDSSLNTKTKMSILNRMATMGQSVLPRKTFSTDRTSDSSDNENTNSKEVKHRPSKAIVKKTNIDKSQHAPEYGPAVTAIQTLVSPSLSNSIPLYTVAINGQLVPLDNTSIANRNESGNEINMIMSEQRSCNSELRINMGRLTDKMDQMLNKIKDLENNDTKKSSSIVEIELYKKLISEYEAKIKMYEDMLFKDKCVIIKKEICKFQNDENDTEQAAIQYSTKEGRDEEISSLKNELATLRNQQEDIISTHSKIENDLRKELANLKKTLASKENELINKTPINITNSSSELEQKLKSVMNDTFQLISLNFENDDTYSGSTIKNVISAIIKKVTLNSIRQ